MSTLSVGPWPLMKNNISREDLDAVIRFLGQDDPILTQSTKVADFEEKWSDWLGVKHSVFVNSGSSANLLTLAALRETRAPEGGEIIVPALTWVSDIASVIQCGFDPVFVDIDSRTMGMDHKQVLANITPRTKAVFITHILGYNALTQDLVNELAQRGVPLIEDVCESHGATMDGKKVGTFSLMSNFSFYYAHHMSTIEGGMVCTNDDCLYQTIRMLRSHGMVRECSSEPMRRDFHLKYPDLNPDFIFAFPSYNVRSTEINAVIGLNQLPRLDANNEIRTRNLREFLGRLDPSKYQTDFAVDGSSNYAFTLVLKNPDTDLRDRVEATLRTNRIEFRRGTSGGGNQLRQPYAKRLLGDKSHLFPVTDHLHFYGWYIGNYPDLGFDKIGHLCCILNNVN